MSYRILIAPRSFASTSDEPLRLLRDADCDVHWLDRSNGGRVTDELMATVLSDVDGVIVGVEPLSASTLGQSPSLRVISKYGVGMDNIDVEAARTRGIPIGWTPNANTNAVAELTMALLFALARRVPYATTAVRDGKFPRVNGIELRGRTLGLIGLGRIGRRVVQLALGCGMRVIAFDPNIDRSVAGDVELVSFESLLAQSDVVSLHLPLSAETVNMINERALAAIKPGAFLINTARGGLIDEDALYRALTTGHLGGAAIDCFAHEPPVGNRLLELENVIGTPHMASHTDEAITAMSRMATENVVAGLRGDPLPYPFPC